MWFYRPREKIDKCRCFSVRAGKLGAMMENSNISFFIISFKEIYTNEIRCEIALVYRSTQ